MAPTLARDPIAVAKYDIRVVQELLAHEDIKSTMLYTDVAPPDRAKAVLRLPWKLDPKVPDGG